jgi:hypothetical protein
MRFSRRSKVLFAGLVAAALLTPAPSAAPPAHTPVDPAVQMYVEQVPTKSGPVASDQGLRQKGAHVEKASNGPTIIVVVAVALVAAAFGGTALRRVRTREKT